MNELWMKPRALLAVGVAAAIGSCLADYLVLSDLPSSRSWQAGFYLGALSMPLYAAGYFGGALLVARNSKAIATLLAASGFAFAVLTGESHVGMGTAGYSLIVQGELVPQGELRQDFEETVQRMFAITPLLVVTLTSIVATPLASLIWGVAILQGKSELPRWVVVALPFPVGILFGALVAQVGQAPLALAAMSVHLAHIPMFLVAWWKATDLPPPS